MTVPDRRWSALLPADVPRARSGHVPGVLLSAEDYFFVQSTGRRMVGAVTAEGHFDLLRWPSCFAGLERVTGIEPALSAWEADVLPLNYTRGTASPASSAVEDSLRRWLRSTRR